MPDMLVKLYDLPEDAQTACPRDESVQIRRAMAPDKFRVVEWVKERSGLSAAGECDVCFARPAVSCFIATRGKKILGYACYDATAPDFFGPTRVLDEEQGGGIGRALLLRSLAAMRAEGYAYAVIGGVGPQEFYKKCVGAMLIPDSVPGIYRDFLGGMKEYKRPKEERPAQKQAVPLLLLYFARMLFQQTGQFSHVDGLCDMRVHAAFQTTLNVLGKGVRRHGDDGDRRRIRAVQPADRLCSLIACHVRHPEIHQDKIIITLRRFPEFVQTDLSVFRPFQLHTQIGQQFACNLPIQLIVLCEQDTAAGEAGAVAGCRLMRGFKAHILAQAIKQSGFEQRLGNKTADAGLTLRRISLAIWRPSISGSFQSKRII